MKFHRVYVELTNICGLKCSFCPPQVVPTHTMSLTDFEHILDELAPYTKEIAYHMGGDPLALSNLRAYLDLTCQKKFKGHLTTSGYFLSKHSLDVLMHPALKQINISLNSYNKNSMSLSFEAYMEPIIKLCHAKQEHYKALFINLRLWNIDAAHSEKEFNEKLFAYLEEAFGIALHVNTPTMRKAHSIRLAERVLLHFDAYFEWPSLQTQECTEGTCLGLKSHFGILSNGKVVPCCLDKEGVIDLGNLHEQPLNTILNAPRTQAIVEGFKRGHAHELLCQKCTYKHRFKEQ